METKAKGNRYITWKYFKINVHWNFEKVELKSKCQPQMQGGNIFSIMQWSNGNYYYNTSHKQSAILCPVSSSVVTCFSMYLISQVKGWEPEYRSPSSFPRPKEWYEYIHNR